MSQKVFCLGSNVYRKSLNGSGLCKLKLGAHELWPVTPPFVDFIIDSAGSLISAHVSNCVSRFEFDSQHRVEAVPWSTIFGWLHICTLNKSTEFLQSITISMTKKDLSSSMFKKRKRDKYSFEEVCAGKSTLECGYAKHMSGASGSRTTLIKNIDVDRYEHSGQLVCKKCIGFMTGTGQDGYLHRSHALPLLKHAQSQADHPFLAAIEMLLVLFECTRDTVLFFNYFKFQGGEDGSVMKRFKYGSPTPLFDTAVDLQMVVSKKKPDDFGCTNKSELIYVAAVAANYKLWGRKVNLDQKYAQFAELLEPCMPAISFNAEIVKLGSDHFLLAVLSVVESDTEITNVFSDTSLAARGYVQIYSSLEYKLNVPGVDSVSLDDMCAYVKSQPKVTVVAWPAQFFSAEEIMRLSRLKQQVILAGTPYVIGPRTSYGQPFTTLYEKSTRAKFYGLQTFTTKQFEGLMPGVPQHIPSQILSFSRQSQLHCPVYKFNGNTYFYRELFITLLYNFLKKSKLHHITVSPGPLFTPTDAELALCSKVPLI